MSINKFVEMTIFLDLKCFSIYDKMQDFVDESGLLIFYVFIYLFFAFYMFCMSYVILHFTQKFKMVIKSQAGKQFL